MSRSKAKDVREGIVFQDNNYRFAVYKDRSPFLNKREGGERLYHEEIEIKYFVEGRVTLQIGKDILVTEPGDIVIINPNEFHSTLDIGNSEGRYHLLMVDLDFLRERDNDALDLKATLLDRGKSFSHILKNASGLKAILDEIVRNSEFNDIHSKNAIKGLLVAFFSILSRDHLEDRSNSDDSLIDFRHYDSIEPALRKIRDSYSEKITLEELAALCNVSKCHFCRLFKATIGMSVVQYISAYRLNIADIMLKNTDLPITEIAHRCGFDSESYFYRYFKKVRGITPKSARYDSDEKSPF